MVDVNAKPFGDARFPEERASSLLDCVLWDVWAVRAAEEALQWPTNELGAEVAADSEYAARIREVYKMLCIAQAVSGYRGAVISEMIQHVEAGLAAGQQLDAGEYRDERINFSIAPRFEGVGADEVLGLRPNLAFFR